MAALRAKMLGELARQRTALESGSNETNGATGGVDGGGSKSSMPAAQSKRATSFDSDEYDYKAAGLARDNAGSAGASNQRGDVRQEASRRGSSRGRGGGGGGGRPSRDGDVSSSVWAESASVQAAERLARDAEEVEGVARYRGGAQGNGVGAAQAARREGERGAGLGGRGGRGGGRGGGSDASRGKGSGVGSSGSSSAGGGRDGGRGGARGGGERGDGGAVVRQQPRSSSAPVTFRGKTAIGRAAAAADVTAGQTPPLVAVLHPGKARLFESGSPMVYSGAVERVHCSRGPGGQPAAGDPVVLVTPDLTPIAWGVFNPVSMFRVRILQTEAECREDESCILDVPALIDLRVRQAAALRCALGLGAPAPASAAAAAASGGGSEGAAAGDGGTTVFRLVNSEGDRLSGVVADQLGDTVVVQSCAAWSERHRDDISDAILRHARGAARVVWRRAEAILVEEGIVASDDGAGAEEADTEAEGSAAPEEASEGAGGGGGGTVTVVERGVKFLAAPEAGQKTGFYADQRDSRAFVAAAAAGKAVLDLCCYSGGFAVSAAAAGAASVLGVDSSAPALELGRRNAELNGVQDRCTFVREDVSAFLKAAIHEGSKWDIVILDPPKLAPSRAHLQRATGKYTRLNALALQVVRPGGLLMTCSCSGAMTQTGGLPQVVTDAAGEVGRQVTLLRKAGTTACHPLHPAYPEGEYLTNLTYRVA